MSVVEPAEFRREVMTSSIEALRSSPGVDIAQTGLDRREVVLRGFNDAFSGGPHALLDHREAAVPSLGANVYSIMPTPSLDLNRIEVIRGPSSALYGPGAESGVLHLFTRDPFREPGTEVAVTGGTRSFLRGQFRQAGVLGDRVGYKFTGQLSRGRDWALDPDHPQDAAEINRYRVYESREDISAGRTVSEIDRNGDSVADAFRLRRDDLYQSYNVNGLLTYRLDGGATLSLKGGYAELTSTLQSGIGTFQADGFGYSYGRLRLESGGLSAQVSLNRNHADADTYLYGSGRSIVDRGLQWGGQLKYLFDLGSIDTRGVAGAEADLTRPRTDGTVLGRNEDEDNINELGVYAQTTTDLTSDLQLTLAGRADHNSVTEEVYLSPRAALVYDIRPQHTIRASYNRGVSSPRANAYFLDLEVQRRSLSGSRSLVYQGRGAADGFTFGDFRQSNSARFFRSTPGGNFFGTEQSLDQFPVQPTYAATAQRFQQSDPALPAPIMELSDPALQAYRQLLGALAQSSGGASSTAETALGLPAEDEALGYRAVDGPADVSPLQPSTTQALGLGYKGTIGNRVRLSVDGYYEQKENVIGSLQAVSPFVYLRPEFIEGDIETRLQVDGPSQTAFQDFLNASGMSEQEALELLAATFGQTASAVVQPDQQMRLGEALDGVRALMSYRNIGEIEYWGVDAAVEVDATDVLEVFGNVSVVSDDFFSSEELDAAGESLGVALNAPSFKVNGGADYDLPGGLSVGLTGRYVDGFPVRSGPYVGDVESYAVADVHAGYGFPSVPGLRLDVTVRNVLDNEHREFVGAPALGRMAMVQLTYELP